MPYHYQFVSKRNPSVKRAYEDVLEILHEAQDLLREQFTFQYTPIGSYVRNMITYDPTTNVGYDFDFNLEINDNESSAKELKAMMMNAFNKIAWRYGYSPAEDSTRVITIKVKDHEHSLIKHSCDFAIVNNYLDQNGKPHQEYIHFDKEAREYFWREQSKGHYKVPEKIDWIKKNGLNGEFRDYYLHRKNTNPDPNNFHSREILAQSVNSICQMYNFYNTRQ